MVQVREGFCEVSYVVGRNEVVRQVWLHGQNKSHCYQAPLSETTSAVQGLDWSLLDQIGNLNPGNKSGNLSLRRGDIVPLHRTSPLYSTLHSGVKPKACFILKARAFSNLPSFMHLTKAKQGLTPRSSAFQPFWADWQPPLPLHFSPGFSAFITTNAVIRAPQVAQGRQSWKQLPFHVGNKPPANALQPSDPPAWKPEHQKQEGQQVESSFSP